MVTTFNDWVVDPSTPCSGSPTVPATDDQLISLPTISAEENLLPVTAEPPTPAHLHTLQTPASQSTAETGSSNPPLGDVLVGDVPVEASLTSQGLHTAGIFPSNASPASISNDDRVVTPVISPTHASIPVAHSLAATPPALEGIPSHPMVTRAKSVCFNKEQKYKHLRLPTTQ
ncbi:hypothetical protein Droror1_Dr00021440 [Drosera rotundifolia]